MKKLYLEPDIELVKFRIEGDVLTPSVTVEETIPVTGGDFNPTEPTRRPR